MKKKRVYRKYRTRKRGGQSYWVLSKKEKSIIGKQKRAKGLRFEFRILNKMKKQYPDTTFRSAGSHSIIDVLVREPHKVRYIAARTSGNFSQKEKEKLKIFDKDYEQVEMWSRPSPKKIKKIIFKKANGNEKKSI